MSQGWVGVDLDGTLAVYDGWKGIEHIGEPVQPVVDLVKKLLDRGIEVRIMTARCEEGQQAMSWVMHWAYKVFGKWLVVTDRKDFGMIALIDDRALPVERNTGRILLNDDDLPDWLTAKS